jgi:hypothetical protein
MLLNDIGKSSAATFKRINLHLEENYGFKISEDVNDKDLVLVMETIESEITELKIKGDDAKVSPEISKRLLVLEGLRNLREFAIMGMKSPKLEQVISNLTDFVVETYEVTALHETATQDFENAIKQAMEEYRSSRYRFPDDYVENRVRQAAMSRINGPEGLSSDPGIELVGAGLGEGKDARGEIGKRATGEHRVSAVDTPQERHAAKVLDNPRHSLIQDEKLTVPMIRTKDGRMVPDPFAAQAAARTQGIVMKENLVKNLRRLLETEVSQAEVMMAAKGFAQELQEMVEKIGRLQNEDLPPVTDQMRETYGMESASAFQTQIYGALQSVMDALYTAKGQVDDAVSNMASRGQCDASVDMDKELDADTSAMDADAEIEPDLDNIEADLDAEIEPDEFGADDALGRAKKMESVDTMKHKISEMKRLVEKARKLREATR